MNSETQGPGCSVPTVYIGREGGREREREGWMEGGREGEGERDRSQD